MNVPSAVKDVFERARKVVDARLVWLHLGADTLWLVRESEDIGASSMALDLGTDSFAQLFFRSDLPSPLELERAIDHVEEELMRAVTWKAGCAVLGTDHPMARAMASGHGLANTVLTREVVEAAFQRLASGLLGDPSALKGLPSGREAAATLRILRELMHHLSFRLVTVPPAPQHASLPESPCTGSVQRRCHE
ncbi:hypothetical protein [Hydrogenophaga sp.]|uniref:hypothetical protein n=1 Tax=Hydrogenophaga sp. TaxID=1904254 RepID=UPI0026108BD9|nr:hypothetical protein [Hydrogenophaga sp.]